MVYETTEYRKKYRWFSPQKRYQIWKENWNFRKNQKLLEFQHEPFGFWNEEQSCQSSTTDEIANEFLPPSKLKQKYLEIIKETSDHSKLHMVNKGTSTEFYSSLPDLDFEKKPCDVGVQTPNWDDLKDKYVETSDKEIEVENDLLEIARRLKEGVVCNVNTLDFINQVIERERSSSPPPRKLQTSKDDHHHLSSNKYQFRQSKSPMNLYSQANKNKEVPSKQAYNIKISKNKHTSALKTQKKKLFEAPKFSKQKLSEVSYKREGHRVINDLKNYVESATKWLTEYDNRYRYGTYRTRI